MNLQLRNEVLNKLNSIAQVIKECALQVFNSTRDDLIQETTLAAITHETLCDLVERDGYTEKTIGLINDFGKAVVELYANITNSAAIEEDPVEIVVKDTIPSKTSKALPN
jgi:hypothetical protein